MSKILVVVQGGACRQIESAIGVFKAFDEIGIRPTEYRACSAGAVVSSLHASGLSAIEMEDILKNHSSSLITTCMNRLTWLCLGQSYDYLADASGIRQLLFERMTGLATLRVKVSVFNMTKYLPEILPATPSSAYASMAVEGVFKPEIIGACVYGDGGVCNNIPMCPIQEINNYDKIFVVLCPSSKTIISADSWWSKANVLIDRKTDSEVWKMYQLGLHKLPNVTFIHPLPYSSSFTGWSNNFEVIERSYQYAKGILK